ncbi:MAG: NAD(P)-dependent oxidoreductase, partial [Pseudomonadota bacterium]
TLGLVGFGRVAQRVAGLAALRYGMQVIVADPSAIPGAFCKTLGVKQVTLDDLMAQSDIVSLHCWNQADTRGLISGPQLDLMQDHAILIDTVGEGVVDRQALFHALSFGMLAGAGVDVALDKGRLPTELIHSGSCIVVGS